MWSNHKPIFRTTFVSPFTHCPQGWLSDVSLGRSACTQRKYRVTLNAQHAYVAKEMLAIFGSDPDDRVIDAHARLSTSEIANVRVEIPPLGSKQIDDIQPLGLGFESRSLWAQEVNMRVRRDPAFLAQVSYAIELNSYFALAF